MKTRRSALFGSIIVMMALLVTLVRVPVASAASLADFTFDAGDNPVPIDSITTYTFSYTTVTALQNDTDAVFYARFDGYNIENLVDGDFTVTVDSVVQTGITVRRHDNVVRVELADAVPSGSDVQVTIANVHNPADPGTYYVRDISTCDDYNVSADSPVFDSQPDQAVPVHINSYSFSGGTGEEGTPYQIDSCGELQTMWDYMDSHFVLIDDIDCSDTVNWYRGRGFSPVGNDNSPFNGSLDGNGFEIDNLTILRADNDQSYNSQEDEFGVGIFGVTNGATINDVVVTNSKVQGFENVGGIIGTMRGGTLTNSSFNATTADNSCSPGDCVWARYGYAGGGLVGSAEDEAIIIGGTTGGPVKGSGNSIGGLVGVMYDTTSLDDSSSTSNTDGGYNIGGAVGLLYDATVENVTASGNAQANVDENYKDGSNAGGLIGQIDGGSVNSSSASGDVQGVSTRIGGLVGYTADATIQNSHATGSVHSEGNAAGGLVGEASDSTITNTYATGMVQADNGIGGGLIGAAWISTIRQSKASGSVSGDGYLGGLIGTAYALTTGIENTIEESYATGYVAGTGNYIGGFVGDLSDYSNVRDSYARGPVTGDTYVGGFVGNVGAHSTVLNSYSTGGVEGNEFGGFNGAEPYTVNASFWDTQTSGTESNIGDGALGKTTAQMKEIETYTSELGENAWDFDETWALMGGTNNDYPCLLWDEDCTVVQGADSDGDGLTDEAEDAGPNGGDANNDSTPDKNQDNVVAFESEASGKMVALELSQTCEIQTAEVQTEAQQSKVDSNFEYSNGLMHFTADCGADGVEITVKQFYYGVDAPSSTVRKYNSVTQQYGAINNASVSKSTIDNQTVTTASYSLKDGGPLDEDATENGTIIDPSGLATAVSTPGGLAGTGDNQLLLAIFGAFTLLVSALCFAFKSKYFASFLART